MFHQVLLALAVIGQVDPAPAVPNPPIPLPLNPNRLVRVHARFAGEVMAVGTYIPPTSPDKPTTEKPRTLRFGDIVNEDQVLAVIWSKEVGEKKNELFEALALNQLSVERLRELRQVGAVSEATVREAERKLEADQILVAKLERTLLSWRLSEDDLEAIRAEVKRIRAGNQKLDPKLPKGWAEVRVRAPFTGIILEMNITKGDYVSTDLDLFKIYDAEDFAKRQKSIPAPPKAAAPTKSRQ